MSTFRSIQEYFTSLMAHSAKPEQLQDALDRGANVNKPDKGGTTPLSSAILARREDNVKYLLSKGAIPKAVNLFEALDDSTERIFKLIVEHAPADLMNWKDYGGNPFVFRIRDPKLVKYIFERGADVNSKDAHGTPYLLQAVETDRADLIKFMIEKGVDVNATNINDATALNQACQNGNIEIVKVLLEAGADIHKATISGRRPLESAVSANIVELVKLLFDAGANVTGKTISYLLNFQTKLQPRNEIVDLVFGKATKELLDSTDSRGWPYIYYVVSYAEMYKNKYVLEKFLEVGVDINVKKSDGTNIMTYKDSLMTPSILSLLLSKGADIKVNHPNGSTPLHVAVYVKAPVECMKILIDNGLSVTTKDTHEVTPFHVTCMLGNVNAAKLFLEKGADVNIESKDGPGFPLMLVLDNSSPKIMVATDVRMQLFDLLMGKGANINAVNRLGMTPLHQTILSSSKVDFAQGLLPKVLETPGLDINAQYKTLTPLARAAVFNNPFAVKLILEKKPDLTIKDSNGKTVVDRATAGEYKSDINDMILEAAEAAIPNTSGKWRGYTQSDLVKLDSIFELEPNSEGRIPAVNVALCPVCHSFVVRGEACKYMRHNCKAETATGLYHTKLYNRYKNPEGYISWCTVCGRICKGHRHYTLSSYKDKNPTLVYPGAGADPFTDDCTGPEGGGGIEEKLLRFRRLREISKELNSQIGTITVKQAFNKQVEETWDGPLEVTNNVGAMLAEKKYNIPASNFPNAPAVFNTNAPEKPNWNQHNYADVAMTAGEAAGYKPPKVVEGKNHGGSGEERAVIQFHHVRADGSVNDHKDNYISEEYLGYWLDGKLKGYKSADFGFCWNLGQGCTARLFPEEIKPFVDEDTYKEYKRKFNWKFAPIEGGGGINFFNPATTAECEIPNRKPKQGGRRKTRKNRGNKLRKATRRR